ncbi:MAG: heavy-metal-associated domain-containing protein [Exilispira sp.]|jgi:copper chaperone CopZ|nr:heavy-metal-associated domain-containing protein [Exilispira sp.]
MKRIKLKITGMKCMGCVSDVQNALSKVLGVKNINVDLGKNEATVDIEDLVKPEDLEDAINKNTNFKAHIEK